MHRTNLKILHAPADLQTVADAWRRSGKRIGFVPTMGALHEGHAALMRQARAASDVVVVSIFVNPAQFGKGEDFAKYPRMLESDRERVRDAGVDVLFVPETAGMYPDGYATFVDVEGISAVLEGASRPGHFKGVATVVTKLLNIVKPHTAYFGQKDAQQVAVVKRLIADLNVDVRIIVVPTVREPDGLALSSRNVYLDPAQRAEAPVLHRALRYAEDRIRQGETDVPGLKSLMAGMIAGESSGVVDYLSVAHAESLMELTTVSAGMPVLISLAVRFGTTRLIDNILVGANS